MGELGTKLGLDELAGGAASISRALLAEFIGKQAYLTFINIEIHLSHHVISRIKYLFVEYVHKSTL